MESPQGDALHGSSPTLYACCGRWLLVNFDCSCLWVRDAEPLKEALSLTPHFLRAKGNALDYKARSAVHFLLASLGWLGCSWRAFITSDPEPWNSAEDLAVRVICLLVIK